MGVWLWLLPPLLALPLGYAAGRLTKVPSRSGLTFVMLLPMLICIGLVALGGPDVGLIILALVVPILAWFILAIVGFAFGRRAINDLS